MGIWKPDLYGISMVKVRVVFNWSAFPNAILKLDVFVLFLCAAQPFENQPPKCTVFECFLFLNPHCSTNIFYKIYKSGARFSNSETQRKWWISAQTPSKQVIWLTYITNVAQLFGEKFIFCKKLSFNWLYKNYSGDLNNRLVQYSGHDWVWSLNGPLLGLLSEYWT